MMPNGGEYLLVGDYICLYSVDNEGYVYATQSSTSHSDINIYQNQDRDKPRHIPNPQAVTFQICIQNRYKLNKKLRKLTLTLGSNGEPIVADKTLLAQTKHAADAENADNMSEQKRQQGKKVRYGEIVQLKHLFANKYIHMCASQTSQRDKNNMMMMLQCFNAKNAQFRILPQYKVKSEGEVVQIFDQIVFESIKSPGHFFHASAPFQIDHFASGSELNLGVERSGFSLIRFCKQNPDHDLFVKGGSVIRLFHKELEAYLVAEGLFDDDITEDVHFRIRVMDQHKPRTLSPPSSGNTFWQIEAETSILYGEVIRWEQQIRLRHMTTRKYLCIGANHEISLTNDNEDPKTVFRLHSVLSERDEIHFESYARIEHVLTGFWLHALKDEDYIRKQFRGVDVDQEQSMRGLRWDTANVRQVSASGESMYDDAFTIQYVEKAYVDDFNYVAGMVPFLLNLIKDRTENQMLNAKKTHQILTAMDELRGFMYINGMTNKNRQKLMRNLRVIDLLVKILQCPLDDKPDEVNLTSVFKEAYDILYTYMIGRSRKNALYFAKYIEFFQTQFTQKGGIGLNVAQMIVELIRDKRKIVDRITHAQIDEFVALLEKSKNYRFLDLLHVLCVCDNVAIPNNQSYIVERWLSQGQQGVYLTARGQDINRQPNILYISTSTGKRWVALHEFVDENDPNYEQDKHDFLIHQLDLYKALCHGRNDYAINTITKELRYLTWEETFLSLRSDILPDAIRAKYCDLTTSLFVDVGNNYSVLDHPNICFVYDYVGSKDEEKSQGDFVVKELVAIFPVLRDWITEFLAMNDYMVACNIGLNMLIEQVLRLLYHLVKFGYYMDTEDVQHLLPPLLCLLDGRHDFPFPKDKDKGYSKEAMKQVLTFQHSERYDKAPETEAIVNAKFQALEVLDLLLTYQRNSRLQSFVGKFKIAEQSLVQKKQPSVLTPLLFDAFNPHDQTKKCLRRQKQINREMRDMFNVSAIFDIELLTKILTDLNKYKYNKLITKSLNILNKVYSSKTNMFRLSFKAQVLLTQDSARVHREVLKNMPMLRRLARAKLDKEQVKLMGSILDDLAEFCHLPMTPDEPHPMNQNILISNGILIILFDILVQEVDIKLFEQYGGMTSVFRKTLYLLKLLARENETVQSHIFERLDILLDVRVVENDLAVALREVFYGNQNTCLKINPRQIQKIVNRAADLQEKGPEFLDLLSMIVKVAGTDLTLKRNQAYVMKYIMQNYKKVAFVLDLPREEREAILLQNDKMSRLRYYISLLDLLAMCAEGENMFIESLCQTILPMDELLLVLNNPAIDNVLKKPFLRCLHHIYMKSTGSALDMQTSEIPHDPGQAKKPVQDLFHGELWEYLASLSVEINRLTDGIKDDPEKMGIHLKTAPEKSGSASAPDFESSTYGTVLYILEGVLPFLETFYRDFYLPEQHMHTNEADETDHLAKACVMLGEILGPLLFKPHHMKNLVNCLTVIVPASNMPNSNLEAVMERFASGITVEDTSSAIRRGNIEYYSTEVELNAKFNLYAKNCAAVFAGHNTVTAQLKIKSKRTYTVIEGDEELPLGEEFQSLVRCFVDTSEKKPEKRFLPAAKLIEQLAISLECRRLTEEARIEMDELNIKCFEVLRAIVHNEERRLPEDWETRTTEPKIAKTLKYIAVIQNMYDKQGAMKKSLPHLASRNDFIAKEVLAFLCITLFNANSSVQKSMLAYFFSTREEVFFMAVRDRMALSTNSIKEKRSLQAQQEAKLKESSDNKKSKNMFVVTLMALRQIQAYEDAMRQQRLSGWTRKAARSCTKTQTKKQKKAQLAEKKPTPPPKKKKPQKEKKDKKDKKGKNSAVVQDSGSGNGILKEVAFTNPITKEEEALMPTEEATEIELEVKVEPSNPEEDNDAIPADTSAFEYRNDGYIELVLKVMARMCDGQNKLLQDYLREQPDNVKSFDIIAEVTRFLNVIYSNINSKNIDLVIQLFETMNEFTAGNQDNRVVIYDNKIIDYINYILRSCEFADCSTEKTLDLRSSISNLVMSLIEENGPGATDVALEVKDTLDKKALLSLMAECYERHTTDKMKIMELKALEEAMNNPLGSENKMASNRNLKGKKLFKGVIKKQKEEFAQEYMDVGFNFYLILARMCDIDPKLQEYLRMTPLQGKAFGFYKKSCMAIEIVKDDYLQKINFRVKNKRVLREEVKEKLKWSVDRSSPSNKIRDLMDWTKDIMKDIAYQQKILKNPIAILLTKGWLVWNHIVTILSFAINILMLITWEAKASLATENIMANTTGIPPILKNPEPEITTLDEDTYNITIKILGMSHNFLSLLVFISYFVCNHPRMPSIKNMYHTCKKSFRKKPDEEDENDKKRKHGSKLDSRFFSVTTFYYVIFLALSIAGTWYNGYFFAFHLLNIVNNNQLLSGVIKAVTQNGKSLIWVAVLGLVVFYLYGMVGFALMRSMFDPSDQLYCHSLWQCTITVIRYGLIGDLFEEMKPHDNEQSFGKFGIVVLYHVSFFIFITTIGLNIIFGIIVDTFSELRDLKWTAESDMRDTCFICSRNSYDFEHHGKGFDHHVRHEHNMWSYIFFFIHLNGTKANDYTALEMYTHKLLHKENYDFFPLDRALSLASMGKDATETKLDDLLGQVTSIVEKQRIEELEKKRREERMKQKQWEQKHRQGLFRRTAQLPGQCEPEVSVTSASQQDDQRIMQLSPLPSYAGHRRMSLSDYAPGILDAFLSGEPTPRRPSITDGRASLAEIGSRPSMSDHQGRLGYLDGRRSSMGDPGGFSSYRQPSSSRFSRQRTLRSMSPVPFDTEPPSSTRYLRGTRSPSRYEIDDPYVRSLSPVLYEADRTRSPSRSMQGSETDLRPTRDLSSLLSPRYPDSRSASPRGAMVFFPESESPQSIRAEQPPPERQMSESYPGEVIEGPIFLHPQDPPTREHDMDDESSHSGDLGRQEGRQ